jgi:hypothetical protein
MADASVVREKLPLSSTLAVSSITTHSTLDYAIQRPADYGKV